MKIEEIEKIIIGYWGEVKQDIKLYEKNISSFEIKKILISKEEMNIKYIKNVRKRIFFEINLQNKHYLNDIYKIINSILGIVVGYDYIVDINNKDIWKKIILKMMLEDNNSSNFFNSEEKYELRLVKAFKYLEKKGYEYELIERYPVLKEESYLKIAEDLNFKIKLLGGITVLKFLIQYLKECCYNEKQDLYKIIRNNNLNSKVFVPKTPIGYLIELSVKHLNEKNYDEETQKNKFIDIINLSTEYIFTLRLESENYFKVMAVEKDNLGDFIQKNILFDNLINIHQCNCNFIIKSIRVMFENFPYKIDLKVNLNDVIKVIDYILHLEKSLLYLNLDEISYNLNIDKKKIEDIVKMFSIDEKKVNKHYFVPNSLKNYNNNPIIRTKKGYFLLDKRIVALGFFDELCNLGRLKESKKGEFNDFLGKEFERFVKKLLQEKGIDFLYGYYNIQDECDLIIENDNYIVFLELKRKRLIRKSMAGIDIDFLKDINDSLIKSQIQCNKHYQKILEDKKIELYDKQGKKGRNLIKTIYLGKRKVKRVSLVFYDYNSINYYVNSRQILVSITNTLIDSDSYNKSLFENINKNLNILSEQAEEIMKLNKEYKNYLDIYSDCYFYNINQFMYILEDSRNKDDFLQKLFLVEKLLTGSYDFYCDYEFAKKIKRLN